jgi:hypothetical protein
VIIREVILQHLKTLEFEGTLSSWVPQQRPLLELETLVPQSSLRLFAPAHLGVLAAGMLGVVQSVPYLDKFMEASLRSSALYQNLRPGSPTLLNLQRKTEELWVKYPEVTALKASMLFGQQDSVVEIGGYSHDEFYGAKDGQIHTEPGHGHTSICKPSVLFTKPIEFVAEKLKRPRAANE